MNCDIGLHKWTLGCFIVIYLIILVITIHRNYDNINDMVSGFYTAPPSFCAKAGLDSFLMYIGDKPILGSTRHGYILATQDSKMIINEPVDFSINWNWLSWENWMLILKHSNHTYGVLHFKTPIRGLPQNLDIVAHPTLGKLVLSAKDTTYAILYRSAELTEQIVHRTKPSISNKKTSKSNLEAV